MKRRDANFDAVSVSNIICVCFKLIFQKMGGFESLKNMFYYSCGKVLKEN